MLVELPNSFADTSTNMAVDAMLLETLPSEIAIFRHYGWIEPAITFGYSQRFDQVEDATPSEVRLCRRATGGGIVDHRNDWTYALIFDTEVPASAIPSSTLYKKVHLALAKALENRLIKSQLAPCPRLCDETTTPSIEADTCFLKPVANDVIRPDGRKIAGAAMKRNRNGLLLQGSIDRAALPEDFDYSRFQSDFVAALATTLDLQIAKSEDLRPLFNGPKIEQEKIRFASKEWLNRR